MDVGLTPAAVTDWIRPRALRPGDRIGVCAPAGAVDLERLDRGVAVLRGLGFEVTVGDSARARSRWNAGTVEERVRDLQALWADDSVAGIVCARGGAGAGWVAERLDAEALAARPKVFMGYSDNTFLHTVLNAHGLVTFHGPMVASPHGDFTEGRVDETSLRTAVFGEGLYATAGDDIISVRPGTGEGRLLGGCLSILAAAAGTPLALKPDPEGTILFLEDLNEPPYKLDRALMQLRQSGAFAGVRGVVFGDMLDCNPSFGADYTLVDVILDALAGLDVPIAMGLSSGHTRNPNVTLPFGVRARLACGEDARLQILEASVS